jgi:transcriptional regulator with PAS, ATPase and Fis domain
LGRLERRDTVAPPAEHPCGRAHAAEHIANVDLRVQAKLLHVVEAKEYFRLGGSTPIALNCRIIALSSTPLAKAVEFKTFRQDLFFRLNLITVTIPPLRERITEIPQIANALLSQLGQNTAPPHTWIVIARLF